MAERIALEEFLVRSGRIPMVDVRSPSEFAKGHMPGARNIPLFDDRERSVVGTAYKQVNREAAIYAGLEFVGKKMTALVKAGERAAGPGRKLLVHCWRGGMRSESMAWLFETLGLQCAVLEGGYKTYRRHIREQFARTREIRILGGRTGSGKTQILPLLRESGQTVIDLEDLANHKGSAFGALGEEPQPTTEHFENLLGTALSAVGEDSPLWLEDESRNIGRCVIPGEFYEQMKDAPVYFLDIPREARARYLVDDYATHDPDELKACVHRIQKRLGGDRTQAALESIDRRDFLETARITLEYYDKAYLYSLEKNHRDPVRVPADTVNARENAKRLMDTVSRHEAQGRH
ncbi:MAG: tRNA 2-selenouridine(34) synthase MnmH [Bacteroidales bacterium]